MPPLADDYNFVPLRIRMLLLYILNGFDMAFTIFLLGTGKFREINPIMALVMKNALATLFLKLILPALLMLYLDSCVKTAELWHIKLSSKALEILIGLYGAVGVMHLYLYFISR